MSRPIIFGEIKGITEGSWFAGRKEMMPTSFHRGWGKGIDGNGQEGASAIVLSGGYEDDRDLGDEIEYTGAGGNNSNNKRQIADQSWDNTGNAGLVVSMNRGLPVRVIRGFNHKSPYSPKEGYTYAGLYSVVEAWYGKSKNGFKICKFRLIYSGNNLSRLSPEEVESQEGPDKPANRRSGTVVRIIRDTKVANEIKRLYNYECQVCGIVIAAKSGRYAEGAHVKGLGKPHDGSDTQNNVLCLCPNHHVMFDKGLFSINDDFSLVGEVSGILVVRKEHKLKLSNLKYHREVHGYS